MPGQSTHLERRKVDDAIDVRVSLEHLIEPRLVCDVKLGELGPLAADELNAIDHLVGGVVQVVRDDDLVARLEQGQGREGPDVARSSARQKPSESGPFSASLRPSGGN